MDAIEFVRSHHDEFVEELKAFIRIPSISTYSENKPDVRQAAFWVAERLEEIGLTNARLYETPGNPLVFASWMEAENAPTVLIYGHYDVQPAVLEDGWKKTAPFDPKVIDGKLYGRGSCDDKGQVMVNIKALQALMKEYNGQLPFNVKVIIEGEEEVSSENLEAFILANQELLAADVAVVSDTGVIGLDTPSIVYGLRGITYMELEVWGPSKDLHSGGFGGGVHNPLQAICEIIASLHNSDGSVNVTGFYDKVRPVSPEEHTALLALEPTEEKWRQETGVPASWGEAGYTLRERIGARPTLEVNGIIGGFTGEGAKTVLPAKVLAKISCRLVPDQDPAEITELVKNHVASITPPTVRSEVRLIHLGHGAVVPIDSAAMGAAVKAFEKGYGKKPVFIREGGSIPVVATMQNVLKLPVILAGYSLPDDGAHGPDEKFDLESYYRGMETSIELFRHLSTLSREELKLK